MKRSQIVFNAVALVIAVVFLILGLSAAFAGLPRAPLDQRRVWHGIIVFSAIVVAFLGGGATANFTKGRLGVWPTGLMIFAYCISVWLIPLGIWGMVLLFSERKSRQSSQDPAMMRKPPRPPAVIFATIVLGLCSLILVLMLPLLTILNNWIGFLHLAHASVAIASFVGLVFVPRMQIIYYLASVALGVSVIKSAIFSASSHLYVPPFPPDSLITRIFACVFATALAFLFWRYSFGKPSREFYRLDSVQRITQALP